MLKGEHKQEEYLKINPKGTVPAMTHGGECICESADIAKYFVNHFAKGNSLYPAEKAAEIDEMMDFIANNLYTHAGALTVRKIERQRFCLYMRYRLYLTYCRLARSLGVARRKKRRMP